MFEDFDLIYCYTRQMAIDDGVLVSISALWPDLCAELPTNLDVACTCEAWALIPDNKSKEAVASFLKQSHTNIVKRYTNGMWWFNYYNGNSSEILKCIVHSGDTMEQHCMTIMLRDQD